MLQSLIYRFATGSYYSLIHVAALFNAKAARFTAGRRNLLHQIAQSVSGDSRPRIWVHCASLGEFEQGRPVMDAIRTQYPDYAIFLTFFSPSGYDVRKNYAGVDYVFYLPLDTPKNARAFLDIINPKCCIFIKYELWYYYLATIKSRGVPALLVSAIFSQEQGFFKWYGGLQRTMLNAFTTLFVQDNSSYNLLNSIGIHNVIVSGDTRFDRVIEAAAEHANLPIAAQFCEGAQGIIVAGSTWPDDETILAATLRQLQQGWKLILAPHEVDENHLKDIERHFDGQIVRWSANSINTHHRVLLIDTIGVLSQLYHYGTVAYIGGGFGKEGVHNVLEAAVYGKPCLFGPVYHQFIEAEALVRKGGAEVVNSSADVFAAIRNYEKNPSALQHAGQVAQQYVTSNGGATQQVMEGLKSVLG